MVWIIGLLTFVLVVDCLLLVLLVLIQLPKKEAGLGVAFGSTTTDALFGAGTGTALTKITKYAAGIFFALTLLLAILNAQYAKTRGRGFEERMNEAAKTIEPPAPPAAAAPPETVATDVPAAAATNVLLTTATNAAAATTNLLISTATNPPATTATNPPASATSNPPVTPPVETPKPTQP